MRLSSQTSSSYSELGLLGHPTSVSTVLDQKEVARLTPSHWPAFGAAVLAVGILATGGASTSHVAYLGSSRQESAATWFIAHRRRRLSRAALRATAIEILLNAEQNRLAMVARESERNAETDAP